MSRRRDLQITAMVALATFLIVGIPTLAIFMIWN